MPTSTIIVALILLAAIAVAYFALAKKLTELRDAQKDSGFAHLVNQNISDTRSALDKNLTNLNESFGGKLDKAREVFSALSLEIQAMKDIGKNIDDLRAIFTSSKHRGNFGEEMLQDMLRDFLPKDQFEMQHKFKGGDIVDAVVRTKDGLIPIDSKFPLESFRRTLSAQTEEVRAAERHEFQKAVRSQIKDIGKKYILTDEGTTNFAIMYIPSEAAFYEIISSAEEETTNLAKTSRVMMTSPNTMSYFLQILRLGREQVRMEENAKKAWGLITGLQQETLKFGEQMGVLARHVTNAKGAMDASQVAYEKLAGKVGQIKDLQ